MDNTKACKKCKAESRRTTVSPPRYCANCMRCYCVEHMVEKWCGLCGGKLVCLDCDYNQDMVCVRCYTFMCVDCVHVCQNCKEYFCFVQGGGECAFTGCVSCQRTFCANCRQDSDCYVCNNPICKGAGCSISCEHCGHWTCGRDDCLNRRKGRDLCANCEEELKIDDNSSSQKEE